MFPKTLRPEHMRQNIDVFDFELTADEMAEIDAIPQQPYYVAPDDAPAFVLQEADFDQQV